MNTSLTRSTGFWLLLVVSLAAAGVGGWLIAGQVGTMTSTLLDGTATGIEVYVGQSLVVVGAALLGAGVLGILITLALVAVQALVRPSVAPASESEAEESVADDPRFAEEVETEAPQDGEAVSSDDGAEPSSAVEEAQNGSSGSTATATKISVR